MSFGRRTFLRNGVGKQISTETSVAVESPHGEVNDRRRFKSAIPDEHAEYRFVYPEFLPDPQMNRRHFVREKLERMDMLKRRSVIEIPEFYVGSILAVTVSDSAAPGKQNRFVGICTQREGQGLRHQFTLRNVVDHQGVEIMYDMYSPMLLKIEVLRLEKRLDANLRYLRDALLEYSTFPLDMEPEPHQEGTPVPINPLKVKMKPLPWTERWELKELKGVMELELPEIIWKRAAKVATPWEKFDLMKEYRCTIPEEQQVPIWEEVHRHRVNVEEAQRRERRRKMLQKKDM